MFVVYVMNLHHLAQQFKVSNYLITNRFYAQNCPVNSLKPAFFLGNIQKTIFFIRFRAFVYKLILLYWCKIQNYYEDAFSSPSYVFRLFVSECLCRAYSVSPKTIKKSCQDVHGPLRPVVS